MSIIRKTEGFVAFSCQWGISNKNSVDSLEGNGTLSPAGNDSSRTHSINIFEWGHYLGFASYQWWTVWKHEAFYLILCNFRCLWGEKGTLRSHEPKTMQDAGKNSCSQKISAPIWRTFWNSTSERVWRRATRGQHWTQVVRWTYCSLCNPVTTGEAYLVESIIKTLRLLHFFCILELFQGENMIIGF